MNKLLAPFACNKIIYTYEKPNTFKISRGNTEICGNLKRENIKHHIIYIHKTTSKSDKITITYNTSYFSLPYLALFWHRNCNQKATN